ncbi:hypothetical protein HZS_1425 [Henneguya salminicola]|nr:hypothetical protein HZS_1425 [Henneguya salminicola]
MRRTKHEIGKRIVKKHEHSGETENIQICERSLNYENIEEQASNHSKGIIYNVQRTSLLLIPQTLQHACQKEAQEEIEFEKGEGGFSFNVVTRAFASDVFKCYFSAFFAC